MIGINNLQRFVDAQAGTYANALSEIQNGKKKTHWMWYIFPQISGLGWSSMSRKYAIKDLAEAENYMEHPLLGDRLLTITNALLNLQLNDAAIIFGNPDNIIEIIYDLVFTR